MDPIDIVPSVSDNVPFSTRSVGMQVSTAGGIGLSGALIQNRGVSSDRVADPTVVQEASGNFGAVLTPKLNTFVARDEDNGDEVLSIGDTLTLGFDVASDRGGEPLKFYPSDPANRILRQGVDRLFIFSDAIGTDYSGVWSDPSTLVLTITNASANTARLGSTTARVRSVYGSVIRNSYGNAAAADSVATLTGSFGSLDAPLITELTLEDMDNADTVYGEGDTITMLFDRATDRGGMGAALKGSEAFVDTLFKFSHALGSRYSGEWKDASSFVVSLINASYEAITTDGESLQQAWRVKLG